MSKHYLQHNTFAGKGLRVIAAAALAAGLVTFGCETNHYNGEPGMSGGPAMAPGPTSTPGSSSGTEGTPPSYTPPPMASSFSRVDALAVAAADAGFRGRVLGPVNPGPSPTGNSGYTATGQFANPSLYANPEVTVNSSISSEPTPVYGVGGGGGGGVIFVAPGTSATTAATSAATNSTGTVSVTSPITVASATALNATTMTTGSRTSTSATTVAPLTVGQFASGPSVGSTFSVATNPTSTSMNANSNNGFLTPTISSAGTLSPTTAANATGTSTTTARAARTSAVRANPSAVVLATGTGGIASPFTRSSGTTAAITASGTSGGNIVPFHSVTIPSPMASSSTITAPSTTTTTRRRAVTTTSSTTAPSTITAAGRVRAVRERGGMIVITNTQ